VLQFRTELTTVLTTTMTTVGLPDTLNDATVELVSCLVTPSARAYGSEGWGFESLRARPAQGRFACPSQSATLMVDDTSDNLNSEFRVKAAEVVPCLRVQR
jgi:hypothetical protein